MMSAAVSTASRPRSVCRLFASTIKRTVLRAPTGGMASAFATWESCCASVDAPRRSSATGGGGTMSSATVAESTRAILETTMLR